MGGEIDKPRHSSNDRSSPSAARECVESVPGSHSRSSRRVPSQLFRAFVGNVQSRAINVRNHSDGRTFDRRLNRRHEASGQTRAFLREWNISASTLCLCVGMLLPVSLHSWHTEHDCAQHLPVGVRKQQRNRDYCDM